jgi:hypothetical protein
MKPASEGSPWAISWATMGGATRNAEKNSECEGGEGLQSRKLGGHFTFNFFMDLSGVKPRRPCAIRRPESWEGEASRIQRETGARRKPSASWVLGYSKKP